MKVGDIVTVKKHPNRLDETYWGREMYAGRKYKLIIINSNSYKVECLETSLPYFEKGQWISFSPNNLELLYKRRNTKPEWL